jgi:hypothetical protein
MNNVIVSINIYTQRRRYEYARPRADHDPAGPENRYLDRYATANTDYVSTRSTFATWRTNLIFFILFFSPFWGDMEAIVVQKTSKYYTTEFDPEEGF